MIVVAGGRSNRRQKTNATAKHESRARVKRRGRSALSKFLKLCRGLYWRVEGHQTQQIKRRRPAEK